jgi:hypothetical protein
MFELGYVGAFEWPLYSYCSYCTFSHYAVILYYLFVDAVCL